MKNIHDLIHLLDEKGIVEITNNGNIKLLFMYNIENDEEIVFSVNDYRIIGLYFDLHYGENQVKECENCNVPIRINGKNSKYCEDCSYEIRNERQKEMMRKRRK